MTDVPAHFMRPEETPPAPLLLRQREAWAHLGVSKAHWYRLLDTEGFPRAVSVPGSKRRWWRREDIDQWIAGRGKDRRRLRSPRPE